MNWRSQWEKGVEVANPGGRCRADDFPFKKIAFPFHILVNSVSLRFEQRDFHRLLAKITDYSD